MERIIVKPNSLSGKIKAIPSKTYGHRMIILSALSGKKSRLIIDEYNDDLFATLNCIKELGADYSIDGEVLTIFPIKKINSKPLLNAGESGSTLRFIIPVATALYENTVIDAKGSLKNRPIEPLLDGLAGTGVKFSNTTLPMETFGKFIGGEIELPGHVSSQFITGILIAASVLEKDTRIILTSELQSRAYVDVTIDVLKRYGIDVEKFSDGFFVKGSQCLNPPEEIRVEGDWSNAAPFLVAGALHGEVEITGMNSESIQGDRVILDILKSFGADVSISDTIKVKSKDKIPLNIDINECPDLLPVLSILACGAKGKSIFTGCHRLKIKESDRLTNSMEIINNLGGEALIKDDSLIVNGRGYLFGGVVEGYGDHRMVMAATIASLISENEIEIDGFSAINKSYPRFFKDFKCLGGEVVEFDNWK
ncbi:3-phosphoshikimate 1-carboxyvinyltransferase [Mediannikoviicoccus vaginalis]|uniref:3-phosphoshikimate 1-carboxyvinyltransferase n=1 Tax=Mediannikoviicoccus vaginalis TaxID=2899727 RepID=UPI001F00D0A4|nr:3-phosphoshikimate 1-carboxyvinyltransferase [Mediannikoviicoccus vaginalis]